MKNAASSEKRAMNDAIAYSGTLMKVVSTKEREGEDSGNGLT